jgi:hypothetical protein
MPYSLSLRTRRSCPRRCRTRACFLRRGTCVRTPHTCAPARPLRRTSASPRRSHPVGRAPRGMPRYGCRLRSGSDAPRPAAARRVVELPVLVALARADRAGVAAAHRDHDVGHLRDLVREQLGELLEMSIPRPPESQASGLTPTARQAPYPPDPTLLVRPGTRSLVKCRFAGRFG